MSKHAFRIGVPVDGNSGSCFNFFEVECVKSDVVGAHQAYSGEEKTVGDGQLQKDSGMRYMFDSLPESVKKQYIFKVKYQRKPGKNYEYSFRDYPSGNSDMFACAISIAARDNDVEQQGKLLAFSGQLKIVSSLNLKDPKLRALSDEDSIESLSNKWRSVCDQKAYAFFVHEKDAKIIEKIFRVSPVKLEVISNFTDLLNLKKDKDRDPLLVSCSENCIGDLCQILNISNDVFLLSELEKSLLHRLKILYFVFFITFCFVISSIFLFFALNEKNRNMLEKLKEVERSSFEKDIELGNVPPKEVVSRLKKIIGNDTSKYTYEDWYCLGFYYYKFEDNSSKAIKCYKKSTSLNPLFLQAYNALAGCYEDHKKALDEFEKIVKKDKRFFSAHFNIVIWHLNNKQYDKGKKYLDKIKPLVFDSKTKIDDKVAYFILQAFLNEYQNKNFKISLDLIDQAIANKPNDPYLRFLKAYYLQDSDPEKAIVEYNKAEIMWLKKLKFYGIGSGNSILTTKNIARLYYGQAVASYNSPFQGPLSVYFIEKAIAMSYSWDTPEHHTFYLETAHILASAGKTNKAEKYLNIFTKESISGKYINEVKALRAKILKLKKSDFERNWIFRVEFSEFPKLYNEDEIEPTEEVLESSLVSQINFLTKKYKNTQHFFWDGGKKNVRDRVGRLISFLKEELNSLKNEMAND